MEHSLSPLERKCLGGVKETIRGVLECHYQTINVARNDQRELSVIVGSINYFLFEDNCYVFERLLIWSADDFPWKERKVVCSVVCTAKSRKKNTVKSR